MNNNLISRIAELSYKAKEGHAKEFVKAQWKILQQKNQMIL